MIRVRIKGGNGHVRHHNRIHSCRDRLAKGWKFHRIKTRPSDLIARMGGEEFLFALVDTPLPVAQDICERLRAAVEAHPWNEVAPGLRVTISLGLCHAAANDTHRSVIDCADARLYDAKRNGRNRVESSPA